VSRSILGMPTLNLAIQFIRATSSLILRCSSWSFLFYITLLVGVVEGKKRIVGEGEREEMKKIGQSSITRRIVFYILFM